MKPTAPTPEPGHVVAGRYVLLRMVGKGGMGEVWRARDERLGRSVAVKTMAERLIDSDVALERFEREARAIAKLRSPHIVQIHDFGVDGFPYMVMELLKGQPLNMRLRARKLDLMEVDHLVRQTCKALTAAHAAGIVHRDLKPGNIFLEKAPDDDEIIKVIDFGLAKAFNVLTASPITQVGMVMGTPRYMSPEHFGAVKKVDARADLWSLAVIAYRALTQKLPFDGTPQEIAAQVLNGVAPPIQSFDPGLPAELDRFFKTAFAKKREDRHPDARAFAQAFTTAIPGASDFSISKPDQSHDDIGTTGPQKPKKRQVVPTQVIPPEMLPPDTPRLGPEPIPTAVIPSEPPLLTQPYPGAPSRPVATPRISDNPPFSVTRISDNPPFSVTRVSDNPPLSVTRDSEPSRPSITDPSTEVRDSAPNMTIQRDMPPMFASDQDPTVSMSAMMNVSLSSTTMPQQRRLPLLPAAVIGAVVGMGGVTLAVAMLLTEPPLAKAAAIFPQPEQGYEVDEPAGEAEPNEEARGEGGSDEVAQVEGDEPKPMAGVPPRQGGSGEGRTGSKPTQPKRAGDKPAPSEPKGEGKSKSGSELFRQPF